MSDGLRAVGAIVVGVVVGYFSGSPQLGFAAAGLIYGVTAPNQKVEGPKLSDLKAPAATYGSPIPYLEGAPRVAGVYAWYSDKRAVANESTDGGKGGPGVDTTLYTYEMDALILLSINEMVGIRRVWSNGKLIWSIADDADDTTLIASNETDAWREIRFYSGADDQLPDPTYEAAIGIGNAPAYRGRASVFIEGLNLGQSGQLPVLTFEVTSRGTKTVSAAIVEVYTFDGDLGRLSSGVCSYVNPAGHVLFVPKYSNSYENRAFRILPWDGAVLGATESTGELPDLGVETNFVYGTADEPYWIARGPGPTPFPGDEMGIDSEGLAITASIASRLSSYARYGGSTLYLLEANSIAGTPTAISNGPTTVTTSYLPHSAALFNGEWYVMPPGNLGAIFVYSGDGTLTYSRSIADPRGTGINGILLTDVVTGELYLHIDQTVFKWSSGAWEGYLSLPSDMGASPTNSGSTMADGSLSVLWTQFEIGAGTNYTLRTAQVSTRLSRDAVPLDDLVSRLCLRTGLLTADDIDVTELAGDSVRALAISQVGSTRTTLEALMAGFLFEAVEGEKIRFVKRGGDPVVTIPYSDLGASGGDPVEPLPLQRQNDIELPARVTVKFANMNNDFQDGAESGDRLVTQSTSDQVVELPLGFVPEEAKRIADATTMDLQVSLIGIGPIALPRKYAALEPTDVVLIVAKDGSTFRARATKVTTASGINTLELVLDDATTVESVAKTSSDYTSSSLVRSISPTAQQLLDTPIFRDADNDAGLYVQVKPAGDRWSGAVEYSSRDNVTFAREVGITESAIFGNCTTVLGDWTGLPVVDESSRVTVNVGVGELSSSTRDAVLNDQTINAYAIGIAGRVEVGQFIQADLVSAGIYTLSRFLRGCRGTEWAMTGHTDGEFFSLISPPGMRRISMEGTLLGIERFYKAVSVGRNLAGTASIAFTNMGVSLKPFSPIDVRADRDPSSGDITLTWQRRTRLATRTIGPLGISIPLGESTEAYAIDIFSDDTFTTIVRTLASGSPSVVYDAAAQTADFGSAQAIVYVRVYQLSAVVGRGYPMQAAA